MFNSVLKQLENSWLAPVEESKGCCTCEMCDKNIYESEEYHSVNGLRVCEHCAKEALTFARENCKCAVCEEEIEEDAECYSFDGDICVCSSCMDDAHTYAEPYEPEYDPADKYDYAIV